MYLALDSIYNSSRATSTRQLRHLLDVGMDLIINNLLEAFFLSAASMAGAGTGIVWPNAQLEASPRATIVALQISQPVSGDSSTFMVR